MAVSPNLSTLLARFCDGVDADVPDSHLAAAIADELAALSPIALSAEDRTVLAEFGVRVEASLARANAWLAERALPVAGAVTASRVSRAYRHGGGPDSTEAG